MVNYHGNAINDGMEDSLMRYPNAKDIKVLPEKRFKLTEKGRAYLSENKIPEDQIGRKTFVEFCEENGMLENEHFTVEMVNYERPQVEFRHGHLGGKSMDELRRYRLDS